MIFMNRIEIVGSVYQVKEANGHVNVMFYEKDGAKYRYYSTELIGEQKERYAESLQPGDWIQVKGSIW